MTTGWTCLLTVLPSSDISFHRQNFTWYYRISHDITEFHMTLQNFAWHYRITHDILYATEKKMISVWIQLSSLTPRIKKQALFNNITEHHMTYRISYILFLHHNKPRTLHMTFCDFTTSHATSFWKIWLWHRCISTKNSITNSRVKVVLGFVDVFEGQLPRQDFVNSDHQFTVR